PQPGLAGSAGPLASGGGAPPPSDPPRTGLSRRRWPSGQRLPQDLRGVLGAAAGEMRDLLPARDARRDDLGLGRSRADGGGEPAIAEGHRDIVVLLLEAEGAGHPATPRVDLADLEARPPERFHRRPRPGEGLLVTVA